MQKLTTLTIVVVLVTLTVEDLAHARGTSYAVYILRRKQGKCWSDISVSNPFTRVSRKRGPRRIAKEACLSKGTRRTCQVRTMYASAAPYTHFAVVKTTTRCYDGNPRVTFGFGGGMGAAAARLEAQKELGRRNWSYKPKKHPLVTVRVVRLKASAPAPKVTITIRRNATCRDNSTLGTVAVNGRVIGKTLELPWRGNKTGKSRIPPGRYGGSFRRDGKRGWRIQLAGVPGRKYIQIHIGNYKSQIAGCILVGRTITRTRDGRCMITHSGPTLGKLSRAIGAAAGDGLRTRGDARIVVRVK